MPQDCEGRDSNNIKSVSIREMKVKTLVEDYKLCLTIFALAVLCSANLDQ